MKKENGNNELVLGNKDSTSSHYRINRRETKVQLMAVVEGSTPLSKCEFLMCQIGYRSEFITAHIAGNGTVTLFKLMDYVEWDCNAKQVPSVEISFENYIHPDTFLKVVLTHFLAVNSQKQAV